MQAGNQSKNEFRKDYLLDEWVIIAANRAKRPSDLKEIEQRKEEDKKNYDPQCPFCPGNEAMTPPETYRAGGEKWGLRVFGNKFAAVSPETKAVKEKKDFYENITAFGYHELVVETPDHGQEFYDESPEQITELFKSFQKRTEAMKKKNGVKYVLCIKNYGRECGASLSHTHAQIITFPIIPHRIQHELDSAKEYYKKKKKCIYCEIIKKEIQTERRIFDKKHFAVIAPYASKWPYESLILTKKHYSSLQELNEEELRELGGTVKELFSKYSEIIKRPPFNFVLHQNLSKIPHYHFHIEVYPNVHKVWGGVEKGASIVLNEVPPEMAAGYLSGRTKDNI
ncbi:MAG: galactose-1-phosphate uridylyltransferase [Candidatus Diapherotrites archaeon]